ncbi:leucyl aminopeptidase family protein [Pengzhenrongella sicca]|uniref:Probable cytosol aminopeptidase n=1 Tax=Pengzhenrongella sicca TaxID=2819238 RepID=A0A8A4ZCR2_9MICO|nr:leucyl aminopeptidase family protein [Pengzhenrongella sicca]QTE28809.1 leucyl aminopeptidase family protein [Pengzhenrongella sicca]
MSARLGHPFPSVVAARGVLASFALADDVEALAVPVAPPAAGETEVQPRAGTADAAARYGIALGDLAERAGLTGSPGEAWTLPLPRRLRTSGPDLPWADLPARLILVGVGTGSPTDLRRAGAALARQTRGIGKVVTTIGSEGGRRSPEAVRAFVEGYLLASYRLPTQGTGLEPAQPARELVLLGKHGDKDAAAITAATVGARATWLARDLTNTPSSTKNPAWLAQRASDLAAPLGLEVRVLGVPELTAEGFGGILAVGSGSASEPRLVTVSYRPADGRTGRHVVVVGKGITFDTGGISIKQRLNMVTMKTDMAGSAVALATVLAAAEQGLGHRVTAVLPLAENHFGAASYRPGDVVRMYGGRTVEVSNTDAEGRMVLADALAFADAELDPDVLIDIATLTGAASVGLGKTHAALYGADRPLVAGLEAAADAAGEPVWHMPLVEEYLDAIRSDVADLRQSPLSPPGAGSITAALFLREFAGRRRWAHLDIAGPARATADRHEITEGATGYGVRLLLRFLDDLA